MNAMVGAKTYNGLTLENVEAQIHAHTQAWCRNSIDIGRDLIAAKELVAHGGWGEWLRRHAGMSERTANRFMQVARAVESGSAMAALDPSKIELLLQLPEGEREAAAERVREEGTTVAELRRQVAALKDAQAKAERKAEEQKESAALGVNRFMKALREKDEKYDRLLAERDRLRGENAELISAPRRSDEDAQRIETLNRDVERLQAMLEDAQKEAMEQAEMRQQAELDNARLRAGQMAEAPEDDATRLRVSVGVFLGEVDDIRYNVVGMMTASQETRDGVNSQLQRVEAWCEAMRNMLNMAGIGGEILAEEVR